MIDVTKRDKKIANIISAVSLVAAPIAFIGFFYFFVFFFTIPMTYSTLHFDFFINVLGYGKITSFFLSLICGTLIVAFFGGVVGALIWVDSVYDNDDFSISVITLGGVEIVGYMFLAYLFS